ncbi:MBL fold metallo-hydrolase [Porticoccaceae bacterium]|jgi:alkyl sulfatase BDS1-like metallo-beta-lactamase superfamily hydrolase|nr:MBL fold metallo-hydrolase [Porticoccaceae bacterium]MDC0953320.1 alkyl sulfatase dimerization domain-containing protein [Porticoccaceae bacterium]
MISINPSKGSMAPALASLFAIFALTTGCDQPKNSIVTDSAHTGASEFTIASNKTFADNLDLDNQQDFKDARRGMIAEAPNTALISKSGVQVWDAGAYDFIQGEAPDTVNPSLWRQAKLNNIRGLFKVDEGIYQLRGFDLANTSLIKGDTGWILVDPLTTMETTEAAMAFAEQHLGDIKLTGVIFTHSHIDHFGGVLSLINSQQAADNNVPIIAPAGFMEESTSENIIAGPAMTRRGVYMFGNSLPRSAEGHVDAGLGKQVIYGSTSILQPTLVIDQPEMALSIDGVEFEFYNMPGSEAPAELTFYLPEHKAFCGAEVLSHVMHNVLTLRGAKVRDALLWSDYIGQSIDRLDQVEVFFNSHHWPTWGHDRIITQMEQQQDMYKFTHDQTVRLANLGYTPSEIAERLRLPKSLAGNFHLRGYYGTLSHNSKAVYQHYFGWYQGNPAQLNPLPPEQSSVRYVEFMGGAEAILHKASESMQRGEYRWVAEVLNHLVFAQPDNDAALQMLAYAYRQLGYQAESGPWRDIYLSGALELQSESREQFYDPGLARAFVQQVPLMQFMKALSVRLDAEKAEAELLVINVLFTDQQQNFVLTVRNSVLHYQQLPAANNADASIALTKNLFVDLLLGQVGIQQLLTTDELQVDGSVLKLLKFFSLLGESNDNFNIVTP